MIGTKIDINRILIVILILNLKKMFSKPMFFSQLLKDNTMIQVGLVDEMLTVLLDL
jgi:hypothetical protein